MPEQTWRKKIVDLLRQLEVLSSSYPSAFRVMRFVISGGTATAVNLGALFTLTQVFGIWYLLSSVFAFAASFLVSFTMQKFWTFGDSSTHRSHIQAFRFLLVILMTLSINTTLLFIFVEYAHLHYLVAQFLSGVFIAFINYLSYKHLVFGADIATLSDEEKQPRVSPLHLLCVAVAAVFFLALALYRLPENPATWLDEGTNLQVSINLAQHGIYGIQTAPDHFVSANFLTTSFPVFYPVALSFLVFGTTILSARFVMVLFMAALCILSYYLVRAVASEKQSSLPSFSLFLLVTFAPLYGHGKNVLGEVPGLVFFVASLVLFYKAEKSPFAWPWVFSGVLAGLSMTTKPIYLLIVAPSMLLVFLIHRQRFTLRHIGAYVGGVLAILLLWFLIHVGNIGVLKEILFAANTNNLPLVTLLFENAERFVTQLQPLYFLGLLILWWGSLLFRRLRGVKISSTELFAGIFAIVSLVLYLASRGFYRYFFPAQVLAIVFLAPALLLAPIKNTYRSLFFKGSIAFVLILITFQGYQTLFKSWIVEFKDSTRSAQLAEHLSVVPEGKSVFFYNVPEAVIFFPGVDYYQYLRFGDNSIRGQENLPLLFGGEPDFVLVDGKFPDTDKIVLLYTEVSRFDKYVLYQKSKE